MRIAVIGAGIVGVTTAYELASDGHEVTVFERHGSVAAQASFANAGLVAPSYVTPWAAPGMRRKVLRSLVQKHSPVFFDRKIDLPTLRWMWRWWQSCRHGSYVANRSAMQSLALYSRDRLRAVTTRLKLDYERSDGCLVLLRDEHDFAMAQPGLALLKEIGVRHAVLDARGIAAVEPGINPDTPVHAGIHLPDDEVGNCRQFAHLLRTEAQKLGAHFRFHTEVLRIHPGAKPQLLLRANEPSDTEMPSTSLDATKNAFAPTTPMGEQPGMEEVDAVVVCAAMDSTRLLAPHGLKLPLAAVHGYSVTAPVRHSENHPDVGPRSGVMDEQFKVAISRLGSRVRVAGCAELGGSTRTRNRAALETLYKVLNDWYPGAARMSQAQTWKGARPMLPDGPPVLGRSGIPGVWLNLGHGSSGWALACGSARATADLLASRAPSVDTGRLGIERLHL